MLIFVTAITVALVVFFLCSIFESVLLSLTRPQVESMVSANKPGCRFLAAFKENMGIPIAAILIVNSAAHTVGTALAGASYSHAFDPSTLWILSIVCTLAILLLAEINPKSLGVAYAQLFATAATFGVNILTIVLRPLLWVNDRISRAFRSDSESPVTSLDEIRLKAVLGRSEGVVGGQATEMIAGGTQLRHLSAHDIMLPREDVIFLIRDMDRETILRLMRDSTTAACPYRRHRTSETYTAL